LVVVACIAALPSVLGHAELVTPTPYNPNPSKSFNCGGVSSGPLNVIPTGGVLSWKLIASDGAGAIRLLVDPAGGTAAFPASGTGIVTGTLIQVALSGDDVPQSTDVGRTFNYNYAWPDLTCTRSDGVCTAQVSSSSSWVACFSFSKTAAAGAQSTGTAVTYAGNCVTVAAGTLTTCSMVTGQTVWVPQGGDIGDMDTTVLTTLQQNLPNPNVFNAAQDATAVTPCSTAYRRYLCADTFIPCNTAGTQPTSVAFAQQPCESTCQEFSCWCWLTAGEAGLYPCNFQNANKDSTGRCGVKFGPNNSTCVPHPVSSTGSSCTGELCGAATHSASAASPLVYAAVALATAVAAVWARNH